MAQNTPRGTPARVLVLLALLMGLAAVSAWRDALRRDSANWVRHPTALGDTRFFVPGQPPVSLRISGQAITLTAGKAPVTRRDDRMFRVTTGFGGDLPYSLFTTRETFDAEADPRLYARVAPHQFLRMRAVLGGETEVPAQPPQPSPAPAAEEVAEPPAPKAIPLGPEEQDFPAESPENGTL